jgi:hypothetical protein
LIKDGRVSFGKDMNRQMGATACSLGKGAMSLRIWGLGIHNLKLLGWDLRIRWMWTNKTDPSRLWAGVPIQVPQNAQALFDVAVDAIVGNGEKIFVLERSVVGWSHHS